MFPCQEEETDDARHTLFSCPAWTDERDALVRRVGEGFSVAGLQELLLRSIGDWRAVEAFVVSVISQKEDAER